MPSLKLKKYPTINLHENYLDLQPEFNVKKLERAKELAREWE